VAGTWVILRQVMTEAFLGWRPGEVAFDPEGVRREDIEGRPLSWTIGFNAVPTGALRVAWRTAAEPREGVPAVGTTAEGDLTFEADLGGDWMWEYRCRAPEPDRLVCLLRDIEGHRVEFVKTSAAR